MHVLSQVKAWIVWFFANIKSSIQSREKEPLRIKFSWCIAIPLLLTTLLGIIILFIRTLIGIADNGDYMRVTHPAGIYQPPIMTDNSTFDYFRHDYPLYQYFNGIKTDYITSQLLLVKLAVTINKLIVSKTIFDIRVIAAIYLFGFLFSVRLVLMYLRGELKHTKLYILGTAIAIFVFADVGYIAYFNSFYGEPLTYVSFLALVSSLLLLHRKAAPDWFLLLVILGSSIIFVTAKQQNSPSAFCYADELDESYADYNIITIGSHQNNEMIRAANSRLFFQYDDSGSYFLSNEKLYLTPDYSAALASAQLVASPYNAARAALIITAPETKHLPNIIKYFSQDEQFWKASGDCLIDDGTNMLAYRFKFDSPDDAFFLNPKLVTSDFSLLLLVDSAFTMLLVIAVFIYQT